ncbi:MAG: 3-deoxy-manno-octulosonate cytidylyltransferase [Myxococcales bacterium]|nr:3-deoxy-manno-octulosonate cytidylyltransferase [Myxococcales bacterium]
MYEADDGRLRCSVCGRGPEHLRRLVPGPDGLLCDECVAVAKDLSGHAHPKEASARVAERPVAVIPARYASTRFPGKPLAQLCGKPMIQHVHERCVESGAFSQVLVATDDPRVASAVEAFGGHAQLTSGTCESGTDRVAEVARSMERWLPHGRDVPLARTPDQMVFINVQGDEPAIHPEALRTLAGAFEDPKVEMATLVRPLDEGERANPNVVKAVVGEDGHALYFSRADLPHAREARSPVARWAHVGIYGYRWATLLTVASLPPSPLERIEGLEQLRALEHGVRIACRPTSHRSAAVDVPGDLPAVEKLVEAMKRN